MTEQLATSQAVTVSARVERRYPLTRLQTEVWASHRLYPDSPVANMGIAYRIDGPIDPDRFAAAFDRVARACDVLRTVVSERPGGPVAEVLATPPRSTELIEVGADAVAEWCTERIADPIDVSACAYDSVLLRHADQSFTWWLDLHHVVTDATSQSIVHRLVATAYEGGEIVESSFATFAADTAEAFVESGTTSAGPAAPPLRPFGARGPATTASERRKLVIDGLRPEGLAEQVTGAFPSISSDLSTAAMFAAAIGCTMQRLDGRSELTVGLPLSNRFDRARRELVGPLMELHPVRVSIEPDDTFAELVNRVLAEILEVLRRARRGELAPRTDFEIVVNVFRGEYESFGSMPVTATWVHSGHVDPAHSIRLQAFDYGNDIEIELDVNAAFGSGEPAPPLERHVATMVAAMLADPSAPVDSVGIATGDDLDALAALTPDPQPSAELRPIHEVVCEALRVGTDRIVAEDRHGAVSAGQFDDRIARCVAGLRARGVVAGDRVGLRMTRSVDVLVAIQAVLRSGAAFVMLDPADPTSRHEAIEADAELRLIIDDVADFEASEADLALGASVSVGLDDIAYVLYTSGSTGLPKGVPISHRGLADYLRFAADAYCPDGAPPVVALHSALIFDLTITSLFLPFVTGGSVIVFHGDPVVALGRIAADDRVTFLKATPSQLEIFARMVDTPRRIRTVVVGGEAFRRPVAEATARVCHPGVGIYNEYGPTEAVVGCMIHRWDPSVDTGPEVPIGGAALGCEIVVLDQFGHPAATGAWGELFVRRCGMASEYLNRPELSVERFVDLVDVPGELGGRERGPWYRTGDRVRIERPGVTVYGGRLDDQMKVNGVRLEPAEVEAAIIEHPRVASALVRLWTPADRVSDMRCVRCGLGTDVPGLEIDVDGVCSVCHSYDDVAPQTEAWFKNEADLDEELADARARSTGDYDCLHLLSGGKDSSYALYQLVERGWRVHALTLDNGFISEGAKENIRSSIDALGITHEFATTDAMNEIFRDSLDRHSNVCQGCYKTIYTMAVARADQLGIPVIVTGLSRGQFFETRLIPAQFESGRFDPDAIDATVLEARKVYHQVPDAVTELLPEQRVFDDDAIFERIRFVDFYRYVDVDLTELYRYLEENAPWVRPADTGRSTNCLINVAGIQVHNAERGYHNYAEPYSWDVRLGHKTRSEALAELDDLVPDGVDNPEVRTLLSTVGYRPKQVEILTAWYQTVDGSDIDPDELRRHVRERVAASAVPAAFVRIDDMPLAASAKADASALPAPMRVHRQGAELVEPETDVERALCEIWADVLRMEQVGVTDDFFELGGDSLAALEVVAAIADAMGAALDDSAVFHARTVLELADLIDGPADPLGASARSDAGIPDVVGAPLSAGEEAMVFDYRRDPGDIRYNVTRWYRLPADVDLDRLETAVRDVAMLHGPLRTAFDPERTQLDRTAAVSFETVDLPTVDEFSAFSVRQRSEPFDLDAGPLVRVHAAVTADAASGDSCTSLLVGMHHISVDAGAFDVFWEQVSRAYEGQVLAEPSVSYAAHGHWQRREVHARHAEFWAWERAASDALDPPDALAFRAPTPPERDGYLSQTLDISSAQLRRAPGRTPFVTALAAAAAALARYSGGPHVEIGITASVKDHPAAAPLVGYFLNTVPVRLAAPGTASVSELSAVADSLVADAIEHRTYPFASIVRDARAAGVRPPDVSAMLAYERLAPAALDGADASHEILASGTAVADVTLFVQERGDSVSIGVEYSGRVLSAADAQRVLDAFGRLLHGAVDQPDASVSTLLTADDGTDFVGAPLPASAPTVLHDFVARVAADPDSTAVVDASGRSVTSLELLGLSLATADRLDASGGLVGVCVGRSVDMVVAMLAAQLAGAGYVPLDPASPPDRLSAILGTATPSAVLVDDQNSHRFPGTVEIAAEPLPGDAIDAAERRLDFLDPADTAYVIFTSGSTGRPRGVPVSHANLAASTAAREIVYDDAPGRFLLTSSIGFDSSIVGLFWPLVSGGSIVLPSDTDVHDVDRLVEIVEAESVTHLLMVPSLYRALLVRGADRLESLRTAIVAGEACTPDVAALHHERLPRTALVNEYGPTEASVWSSVHRVGVDDSVSIPIGRPIPGATLRIAGPDGRATPVGVAGELLVTGPTVTGGYLDDPAATAWRFVELDERLWYRTGDLVSDNEHGTIDFVGRVDDQLNVGGVRIEPGDVEAALNAFEAVSDSVVVASSLAGGRLVAHVEADQVDETLLRRQLAEVLPATHVPARIVAHRRLPRTSHGKLDRRAAENLALEALPSAVDESVDAPADDLVDEIVAVWRTVLGRDDIIATTDYFEAGGDSLAAVEIIMAVEVLVDRPLTIGVLLDGRTPAGIAHLAVPGAQPRRIASTAGTRLFTLQAGADPSAAGDSPVVIYTPGWDDVFGYRALTDELPDHVRVLALSAADATPDELVTTIGGLGAAFEQVLRREAAADLARPITVMGWSTGGVVAYDLAGRLQALGCSVGQVVMVDTFFPGAEQHLWSNRWWKYKSLLKPAAFANEVSTTIERRSRKYATSIGKRLLEFAGTPVPELPERTSLGGVPLEAFGYRPEPNGLPVVMYAASTTNPARTYEGWRTVATVDVVRVEGRHRGFQSIMGEERVAQIASDLADRV